MSVVAEGGVAPLAAGALKSGEADASLSAADSVLSSPLMYAEAEQRRCGTSVGAAQRRRLTACQPCRKRPARGRRDGYPEGRCVLQGVPDGEGRRDARADRRHEALCSRVRTAARASRLRVRLLRARRLRWLPQRVRRDDAGGAASARRPLVSRECGVPPGARTRGAAASSERALRRGGARRGAAPCGHFWGTPVPGARVVGWPLHVAPCPARAPRSAACAARGACGSALRDAMPRAAWRAAAAASQC